MTLYLSYKIEFCFPYAYVSSLISKFLDRKEEGNYVLGILFSYPKYSNGRVLLSKLLLLAKKYLERHLTSADINNFIKEYGFLSSRNLQKGDLETPEGLKKEIENVCKIYNHNKEQLQYVIKNVQISAIKIILLKKYFSQFLLEKAQLSKNDNKLKYLIKIAGFIPEHIEERHYIRLRCIRIFREILAHYNMPIYDTSITTLSKDLKSIKFKE